MEKNASNRLLLIIAHNITLENNCLIYLFENYALPIYTLNISVRWKEILALVVQCSKLWLTGNSEWSTAVHSNGNQVSLDFLVMSK